MPYPYYTPQYNFNPYSYGYQPQQMAQQPIQQPQMMQPVQNTQNNVQPSPTQISNVWIYNESEISNYPIAPNNAVRFWIANKQVFYEKSADATGKPTLKVYEYAERTEQPADGSKNEGGKDTPYATKEDVAALASVVKGFDGMIASMRGDIEKMSGDLYGLAGSKKKPTKKAESEEES